MKKFKKHPEFIYMVVSLTAFVCTAILAVYISRTQGYDRDISFETVAVTALIASLILPVVIKAYAYSNLFKYDRNENNFSASYAINEYGLTGWISGKYTFLEAVSEACNGNFERGFELYTDCLAKAEDKRLRRACYKDMVRNLSTMNDPFRLVPYIRKGCEEFPEESDLFEWVASYYMWYRFADEKEAAEWFESAVRTAKDDKIAARAHFYMGLSQLYNREYEKAETTLQKAYDITSPKPCYLCIDMAVCKGCLGKFDEAREFAAQAVALADNKEDIDYISEKITYLFKSQTENVNPEIGKLIDELKRRRDYEHEDPVKIKDIERYNTLIEAAKQEEEL